MSPHDVLPMHGGWARFSTTDTVLMRVRGWRRWWLELRGKASVERVTLTGSIYVKGGGVMISLGAGGGMTILARGHDSPMVYGPRLQTEMSNA